MRGAADDLSCKVCLNLRITFSPRRRAAKRPTLPAFYTNLTLLMDSPSPFPLQFPSDSW